jgi:ankyrin repeat protein
MGVLTTVRELLDRVQGTADFSYVDFVSINDTNVLGDSALHCVCVWGDLDAVVLLVENGIDVHQKGEHGFTPLRVASEFGFTEIVEYLLSKGADPRSLAASEAWDAEAHARHAQELRSEVEHMTVRLSKCNGPVMGGGGV